MDHFVRVIYGTAVLTDDLEIAGQQTHRMNWPISSCGHVVSSALFELLDVIQAVTLSSASHHDSGIPSRHYLMVVDHLLKNLLSVLRKRCSFTHPIFGMPSSLRFWVDDSEIATPRGTHHPDESWSHSRSDILIEGWLRNMKSRLFLRGNSRLTHARRISYKKAIDPAICQAFSKFGLGKIKKISLSDKISIAISSLNQSNNRMFLFRGERKRAMSWSGRFWAFDRIFQTWAS
jgi:hypothetical protein